MNISYQGIGACCATFACEGISEGALVKVSASGTVEACAEDNDFCGVVLAVGRDGKACTVQLGGLATVPYSGETAPALGYDTLAADDAGGVKAVTTGGRSHLVLEKDTGAGTVTIML